MNTRDKILDKALEMFNERGIEYVGLRELAAILGIRVGNITYYFPTKDDLVYALSVELSKANSAIIVANKDITLSGFLAIQRGTFETQQRFRCLLLSFVHIMKQNSRIAEAYKHTQKNRLTTIRTNIRTLSDSGYLKLSDESQVDFLVSAISLISRFWLSEASISFNSLTDKEQIRSYLTLVANLFMPYTTAKGKKDIRSFKI